MKYFEKPLKKHFSKTAEMNRKARSQKTKVQDSFEFL
jgi:hypothetical protein